MSELDHKLDTEEVRDTEIAEFRAIAEYLQGVGIPLPPAITEREDLPPLAPETELFRIEAELKRLPADQCLVTHRDFRVYYGSAQQLPATLREITRLRELTFRLFEEGSGQELDSDVYDHSYLHLFIWDARAHAIVGAYRLGRTDLIRAQSGDAGVYLAQMFDFDDAFWAGSAMLEIGRSFVVPAYQKSHSSLYLLWAGIGQFLVQHPQYRRLYGVVSISRVYDGRTSAVVRDALVEPSAAIRPKAPYRPELGATWQAYLERRSPIAMQDVSKLVRVLEDDKRDVPVLIKHYHKLGARFLEAAVDAKFNNTPGLLLRLDVAAMPERYIRTYLRDGAGDYLGWRE